MKPEEHQQAKEIFLKALELAEGKRLAYVDQACRGQTAVRTEVESLLEHHSGDTLLHAASTIPALKGETARHGHQRSVSKSLAGQMADRALWQTAAPVIVGIAAVVFILAVSYWVHVLIKSHLRHHLENELYASLDADVEGLRLWVELNWEDVESWTKNPKLRGHVAKLVTIADESRPELRRANLLESSDYVALAEMLGPEADQHEGAAIFSRTGICLAHSKQEVVGSVVAEAAGGYLSELFQGKTILINPTRQKAYVAGFATRQEAPVVSVAAPIRDTQGRIIAALGFGFHATEEFTRIFSATPLGQTGETYAFNERFLFLSDPRQPPDQLAALFSYYGVARGQQAALQIQVRDPGGDISQGHQPQDDPMQWPPTAMAASAVPRKAALSEYSLRDLEVERSGSNLDGYRNYQGVKVVGVWRWLRDVRFGLATEVQYQEAYAPLRFVTWGTRFLVLLVGLLSGVTFVYSLKNSQLREAIGRARRLGQYTLGNEIGRGGMGVVYKAHHVMLQRPTAIKLLKGDDADPETVARFEREVRLTCQLTHPNTIEIYDYGRVPEGTFYYAMELLEPGLNLAQLVARTGPAPVARTVHILRQICGSLGEAHDRGLIHRDIKPQNIMLCERGGVFDTVKVLDFGLVKCITPEKQDMTRTDRLRGTPLYTSPERVETPDRVDARCDLYSLGALAFVLLTGRNVFQGTTAPEILQQTLHAAPQRASQFASDVPWQLDQLIINCLEKDPDNRPTDIHAVADVLESLAATLPWPQEEAKRWWSEFMTVAMATTE